MTQQEANMLFTKRQYVCLSDGARVGTNGFVSKISSMISKLLEGDCLSGSDVPEKLTVIYVYNDKRVTTACVDENYNLYISVNFVYSYLKMNDDLINVLLSNALMHLDYSDLAQERSYLTEGMYRNLIERYVSGRREPVQLTLPIHHALNIAAELGANNRVQRRWGVSIDVLKRQMKAVALKKHNGLCLHHYYHHTEIMDMMKERVGKTFPQTPSCKEIPMTYYSGYKQVMDEIVKSIDEFGIAGIAGIAGVLNSSAL